jgi:hypothetical protein
MLFCTRCSLRLTFGHARAGFGVNLLERVGGGAVPFSQLFLQNPTADNFAIAVSFISYPVEHFAAPAASTFL